MSFLNHSVIKICIVFGRSEKVFPIAVVSVEGEKEKKGKKNTNKKKKPN